MIIIIIILLREKMLIIKRAVKKYPYNIIFKNKVKIKRSLTGVYKFEKKF